MAEPYESDFSGVSHAITLFNSIQARPIWLAQDAIDASFDAIAQTGIGSFQIDPGATPGDADIGQIVLLYNVTDLDPNDPSATTLATDQVMVADATVTVSGVPEPGSLGLLAVGLTVLGFVHRRACSH